METNDVSVRSDSSSCQVHTGLKVLEGDGNGLSLSNHDDGDGVGDGD